MALKTFKPVTPSTRQLVIVDRSELHKGDPVKALTEGLRKTGGRNNRGRITVFQRGGVLVRPAAWSVPASDERSTLAATARSDQNRRASRDHSPALISPDHSALMGPSIG